jgi:uncharacterized membrane protein YkvA (DUF1232 family)
MKFSIESLYNWYRDVIRNPKYRWWVVGASLLYLLSPLDISPDVFPILGWIDDGVIATVLVAELSQILLDRLKSDKANNPAANTPGATTVDTPPTVEVNAVSLS